MMAWILAAAFLYPPAAGAMDPFAGDPRLECEYRTLTWRRIPVLGDFRPVRSVPCSATPWTAEGERLWGFHRAALDRRDRCTGDRWQRRLTFGGAGGALGVIASFTVSQVGKGGIDGNRLAAGGLGGVILGVVLALLTEGRCPSVPVPEWAR